VKGYFILTAVLLMAVLIVSCNMPDSGEAETSIRELTTEMTTRSLTDHTIYGYVINSLTGEGWPGFQLKAYDSDIGADDYMGQAFTDHNGYYEIHYAKKRWDPNFGSSRRPDIYVEWYFHGSYQGRSATHSNWVMKNPLKQNFAF